MHKNDFMTDALFNNISKASSLVIAFSPQVHLTPYIFSILLKKNLLTSNVLLFCDNTKFESQSFSDYPNIVLVDQKTYLNNYDEFFNNLFYFLSEKKVAIEHVLLHNFAHELNRSFVDFFTKKEAKKTIDILFINTIFHVYSDGSRNNLLPEQKAFASTGGFLERLIDVGFMPELYFFGFVPSELNYSKINVISYRYVEPFFTLGKQLTSEIADIKNDNKISLSVVLSRYFGKGGYKLLNNTVTSIVDLFVDCVSAAVESNNQLVLRFDDRFLEITDKVVKHLQTRFQSVSCLESWVDVEDGILLSTILMERISIENPNVTGKVASIYCFDSSFPLVFQNKSVYRAFQQNLSIIVGASTKVLQSHNSTDEFISLIRFRTTRVIYNCLKLGLFRLYDLNGNLLYSENSDLLNLSSIEHLYDENDGLLKLKVF